MKIGNIELNTCLALAPMAGVTDLAFRQICREAGAGLTYTEMVSSRALVYRDKKTNSILKISNDEHPVSAQIFGSDAKIMGEAAALAAEISGADFIDINMGCPTPKIVKSGDGCALMRDPDNAAKIVEEVVANSPVPVTVKFRKGWDNSCINAVKFAKIIEQAGASAICVHGRTKVQMYSGRSDWDIIRDVVQAVKIPVIANGDVFSAEDAIKIMKYTGAVGSMIGRAAFGNPWLFTQAKAAISGEPIPPMPPLCERLKTAVHQFELAVIDKGERIAILEARKHYAWYLKGVRNAGFYKDKISHLATMEQVYRITREIQDTLI